MIKDPPRENFWRSARWVVAKNAVTVFDHSARGRARRGRYARGEKGRATIHRRNTNFTAHVRNRRYNYSDNGTEKRQQYKQKLRYEKNPMNWILKQMNAVQTRIREAHNGL